MSLQADWRIIVDEIYLKNSANLSWTEFLSKSNDRLLWQTQSLPSDELCIQNAIIMKNFNRYPLIIDPSD